MNTSLLRYAVTYAACGSAQKAAERLGVSRSSVTRNIKRLEEELGATLFIRGKRKITLTEEGMLLRRRAEEIVSLAEKTKDDFRHRQEHLAGTISIGSGELKSSRFLTRLITDFQKENPLVTFTIYSGNSDNIKERIERGLLDVGLLQEPVDITRYSFVRTPVREEWGILVREDSPLAFKSSVSPEDLAGVPLILPSRENVQNELLNWFGPHAEHLHITATGNLLYNLAFLARDSGSCVLTLNLDCSYEGLRFVPLSPKMESGTVLVWKKAETFSPAATAFLAYARDFISGKETAEKELSGKAASETELL